MKKVLCIDFLNLLYRSFYGLLHMRNSNNINIGGIFSFIKTLYKFIDLYQIDNVIIFGDGKNLLKKTLNFDYKSHRDVTPEELLLQKTVLIEYFNLVKIPLIILDNYEADDLIDNYVKLIASNNFVYILSSDKDLHSLLLLDNVFIIDLNKDILLDRLWLKNKYMDNIDKNKLLLYYSLCGDSSDNISGIKGIGPKTAQLIIEKYSSIDDLYNDVNYNKISTSSRVKKLLTEGKLNAYKSYKLLDFIKIDPIYFIEYIDLIWDKDNLFLGNELLKKYECLSLLYNLKNNKNDIASPQNASLPYAKNLFTTKILFNEDDYNILKNEISQANIIALDTETFSGDPRKTIIIGFSICTNKDHAWYIPLVINGNKIKLYDLFIGIINYINEKKICIMHNALFDMHVINTIGVAVPKNIFDTMLAAYIFKENKIGLKELSLKILLQKMNSFSEIMEFGVYKTFDEVNIVKAAEYAATDSRQTFLLYEHYNNLLAKNENSSFNILFKEIEMPLLNVLFKMESCGILCDKNVLINEEIKYVHLLNNLNEKIKNIAWEKNFLLNPMSNKQTAIFLYDILKLPSIGKNKKTDQLSLSAIEHLHDIVPLIILYRSLKSNISHFTTGLIKYIENNNRIYTHYQQFSTYTGRVTTINPNLQNIPRTSDIYNIRKAFYAADGFKLVSFDYSQIELRILTFFSKDPLLIKLFHQDKDIHQLTASMIFKKDINLITNYERQIAKKINFSIIYGQGAYALSKDLKISLKEAKEYLAIFAKNYSGVFSWIEKIINQAKYDGFVITLYGLKRLIPELADLNKNIFQAGKRIAVNTIIQGTAAEIMKKALIVVNNYLEKNNCGSIVLQIHDELLIELIDNNIDNHCIKIKNIMEEIINNDIKLKVNIKKSMFWE